ncbi:CBS domain-containing protein [bacterium]|nr:CBS domain-containing protein [bacterium]
MLSAVQEKMMKQETVADLMIPLDAYPAVADDATMAAVVSAMRDAARELGAGKHPARAVLVRNAGGAIVGQIGHLDVIRGLELRAHLQENLGTLSMAGVSGEVLDSLEDNLNLLDERFEDVCRRAALIPAGRIMRPIGESIDENSTLSEAMHRLVRWQTPRILVVRSGVVVGVLRLADVIDRLACAINE